jgi:hypothetical protein
VPCAAANGGTVDIAVPLTAPSKPGRYVGYWRLVAPPAATRFGHRVWADVFVEEPAAAAVAAPAGGEPQAAEGERVPLLPVPVRTSDGGASLDADYVLVAGGGNSNAAAVLAALAQAPQPSPAAPLDASVLTPEARCNISCLYYLLNTHCCSCLQAAPAPSPVPAPAPSPIVADRWAIHQATLASMGFTDAAVNGALLEAHGGNLLRVVNALIEQGAAPVTNDASAAP